MMQARHNSRIAKRQSQEGSVIFLMLIFAIPVIALAYVGLVVEPGFKLLQQRMYQHQADTAALSLRWEYEMTHSAQAQEEECIHPDCFRGKVVDRGEIYIEVEKNNDSIKAFSLAMIPAQPGAKPIIVD